MHFKHLQKLQWQLSEHGIFCAKAFLQADAAFNSGMASAAAPLSGQQDHCKAN
jgi:hypothetical protein